MRRSSRSVCSNIGEAWRKRRYPAHFVSKLSDSEGEAEETRVWLQFATHCQYIGSQIFEELDRKYDLVLSQLVRMIAEPEKWVIRNISPRRRVSPSPCRLSIALLPFPFSTFLLFAGWRLRFLYGRWSSIGLYHGRIVRRRFFAGRLNIDRSGVSCAGVVTAHHQR